MIQTCLQTCVILQICWCATELSADMCESAEMWCDTDLSVDVYESTDMLV